MLSNDGQSPRSVRGLQASAVPLARSCGNVLPAAQTNQLTPVQDPKLWYGFGILYERYGLLKLAEEAFIQVVRVQPNSERAKEVYFRLGVIYKQQQKFQPSLEVRKPFNSYLYTLLTLSKCFRYIVQDPPLPLREEDIWFQIGNVHEQENEVWHARPNN